VRVLVVGSGSTGNGVLVESPALGFGRETRVLVDAGIGPRLAASRLRALGVDLFPRGVDAIVVTHQHGDHCAHLEPLARALRCPVYLHEGIEAKRVRARYDVRPFAPRRRFKVGAIEIDAVAVPHDSPQVALRLAAEGASFGIATDVGAPTRELVRLFGTCDAALLEANHCRTMLWDGPYPWRLKKRVSGGLGHLSNEEAAHIAGELVGTQLRRLYLGHISTTNNTVESALAAVRPRARGIEVSAVPNAVPMVLRVTPRGQLSLRF
jgi:phosphoribosyl 1,2-cyclic phosphodiesterase